FLLAKILKGERKKRKRKDKRKKKPHNSISCKGGSPKQISLFLFFLSLLFFCCSSSSSRHLHVRVCLAVISSIRSSLASPFCLFLHLFPEICRQLNFRIRLPAAGMKRVREEFYGGSGGGSQFKRTLGSSSYVQPPIRGVGGGSGIGGPAVAAGGGGLGSAGGSGGGMAGAGGSGGAAVASSGTTHKLTTSDALAYLKEVKDKFQDQKEKYDTFLEVMKDFKAQRTDTAGVIARVKELFKGHNSLIYGFNTFIPKGYEIILDEDEAPPKKTVEFEEAMSFVNKIKKRFQNDEHVYKSFLDTLKLYRKEHKDINEVYREVAVLFKDHPDLLDEFTRFLPDNSGTAASQHAAYGQDTNQRSAQHTPTTATLRPIHTDKQRRPDSVATSQGERNHSFEQPEMDEDKLMIKAQKEQKKRVEKDSRDKRSLDQNERELDHDSNMRKPSQKVEGSGVSSNLISHDNKDGLKSMYHEGFVFCEKVKEKLGSSDDYQAFLKCLNIFNNGIIKKNDLQNLVTDLLGRYPDLMEEFNDFLQRCENIDGFLAGVMSKKSLLGDGHAARSLKVEARDKEPKQCELDLAKEKEKCKEKYMEKSIQELDLSNCQRCTPSYRLLPDDYPIPLVSQRSDLGSQVLNDYWVSVTSGSEDYSFKHMRRNQYEESLFRCEDDRFELDMLLEAVSSTAKRVEELVNNFNENKIESPIRIDELLTALNLRCIERLYGDHGLDVLDILRKNPAIAFPVILTRLKQKQEEWTHCRTDFNKVWAEIYAKNHYKSLDHRSFYFKQQDSKNLSSRSLITEIKELKDKQPKEDDVLLAFAAGKRQSIAPNLEFEYSDVNIHEDLRKIVQYSCEEVCSTKEQLNRVMRLWTTFVELMLGISQSNSKDYPGGPWKDKHLLPNDTTTTLTENGGDPAANVALTNSKSPILQLAASVDENTSPQLCATLATGHELPISFLDRFPSLLDQALTNLVSQKMSVLNLQSSCRLGVADTRVSLKKGSEQIHIKSNNDGTSGHGSGYVMAMSSRVANVEYKAGADDVPSGEVGGTTNGGLFNNCPKVNHNLEKSTSPSKIEKEEGELSPNGEFEDNFVAYGHSSQHAVPKSNNSVDIMPKVSGNAEELHCPVGEGENDGDADADADDEDSENASEAADDASTSESAGDECSREEHDEDEDLEHDDVDGKVESECEAEGTNAHFGMGDVPLAERVLLSVKPLAKYVPRNLLDMERKDLRIFYGNDDFYVLFRLHQILYERILSAKKNSTSNDMKWRSSKNDTVVDPYARFITALYNLLDGSADNAKFEDECRAVFGNQSYELFTLDKLIYKIVKQLQVVAADEMDNKLLQLYEYESSRKTRKSIDSVYYANVRYFLHEENVYRLAFTSSPYHLLVQLMDNVTEKPDILPVSVDPNFTAYLQKDYLSVSQGKKEPQGIILHSQNLQKQTQV
ncbi:Paired amphipathic helix protein Sin3-like 2, partial [Linum perenne]